ncbi:HAMP domain-containing sensor histidine kinase [Herbidospora sp. NBRC 101105]|uniref:sensor histidine kinase n=1 Tax=Herbidospora sp. NBRC 101105 TaxID=3032195 RepID=UPI0025554D81|nr:HAMP domain-containing sensor histidine kinase [Herbidospora sp. NBRC 101105]
MSRVSLRTKLIAAMLALVAWTLLVIGAASVSLLRSYLIDRVDEQVAKLSVQTLARLAHSGDLTYSMQRLPPEGLVQVVEADGTVGPSAAGESATGRPSPADLPPPGDIATRASGGVSWRVKTVSLPSGRTLVTAIGLGGVTQITTRLGLIVVLGGAVVLALAGLIGIVLVRRSLRPLAEIERTAGSIAAGNMSSRVPDRDPRTEVGRLARSLNGMLAQIEKAFDDRSRSEAAARESEERMRRFVADASHELRTPLTSIRGYAEFHRQAPQTDVTRLMRRIESEAERMSLLVDDLLLLARLDQQRPLQSKPVDLLAIAGDAVQDARILAPGRSISLAVEGTTAPIVPGDEVRLRQVVGNLMSNALTHTPDGVPVTVTVGAAGSEAFVEVADKGPGMTSEEAARVFERFYRADPARTHDESSGTGLGLSIVSSLVKAHGGTVTVETSPGTGAAFRVVLRLEPEHD